MITFTVPGNPVANPRPKATRAGQVYSPKTKKLTLKQQAEHGGKKWVKHPIVIYKEAVVACFQKSFPGHSLISTPIQVDCLFVFSRPQRLLKKSSPEWMIPHDAKPDRDNLDKAVLDALNGVAWTDDAIVSAGEIRKRYAKKITNEGYTQITISVDEV